MKLQHCICFCLSFLLPAGEPGTIMAGSAVPLGTSFSYQGQLKQDGLPLNGIVDLEFSLHPALVTVDQIGTDFRISAVEVINGLFNVEVDFGTEVFTGSPRWLEVRVRTPHDPTDTAPFITLDPRQEVRPTPYATRAETSAFALSATFAQTATTAQVSERPFREVGVDAVFEGGNVGIGTTSPTAPLDVAGEIRSTGTDGGIISANNPNNPSAAVHLSWQNDVARIRVGGSGAGNRGGLDIQTLGDTSLMRLMHNGNVGIGESNPTSDLHVRGSLGLRVDDEFGTPVLIARGNGNVGVGTFTPTAKLNVESDANLIQGPVMQSDDIIVESADAVLGLYSDGTGATGSAISLKEIGQQGRLTDHWAMYRETNQAGSNLHFTYGPNIDYAANPSMMTITTAPTTRYMNVSANSFALDEGLIFLVGRNPMSLIIRNNLFDESINATADVRLPQGATVIAMKVLLRDIADDYDLRVQLLRMSLTPDLPNVKTLAEVTSSGVFGEGTVTGNAIDFTVIDNQSHMYGIHVNFPAAIDGVEPGMLFMNARIEYTVQTPMP